MFHVHIDASVLAVSAILTQLVDDATDHPNAYTNRKLNRAECNYSITKREGLGMAFSLQIF